MPTLIGIRRRPTYYGRCCAHESITWPRASDRFRQYLENLGRDIEPGSGFFSPDTVFWRVSREPALLLAGMRALLLQIAHPKIAQGVADHSRYREDPLGRGIRTFTAVYSIVFGRRDEAIEAAMRVRFVHDSVHGQVMGPAASRNGFLVRCQ